MNFMAAMMAKKLAGGFAGATHWRVLMNTTETTQWLTCSELQFRGAVGGADLTTPAEAVAKAFTSGSYGTSYGPDKAFDSTTSSVWYAPAYPTLPAHLGWVFDTAVDIVEVYVGPTVYPFYDFDVQYSLDAGTTWVTKWSDTVPSTAAFTSTSPIT